MYEYKCKVNKVIDGDTVDVDIDLGFGVVLTDERVRVMGIDTPESRTRNKVEKLFGLEIQWFPCMACSEHSVLPVLRYF